MDASSRKKGHGGDENVAHQQCRIARTALTSVASCSKDEVVLNPDVSPSLVSSCPRALAAPGRLGGRTSVRAADLHAAESLLYAHVGRRDTGHRDRRRDRRRQRRRRRREHQRSSSGEEKGHCQ